MLLNVGIVFTVIPIVSERPTGESSENWVVNKAFSRFSRYKCCWSARRDCLTITVNGFWVLFTPHCKLLTLQLKDMYTTITNAMQNDNIQSLRIFRCGRTRNDSRAFSAHPPGTPLQGKSLSTRVMVTKVSLQRLHFRLSLCHGTRHPIRRVNMAVQLLTPHQDQRMCLHPPEWFLWSVWLASTLIGSLCGLAGHASSIQGHLRYTIAKDPTSPAVSSLRKTITSSSMFPASVVPSMRKL